MTTTHLFHAGLVAYATGTKLPVRSDGLPTELLVAPWGSHDTAKGKITINRTTVDQLPRAQALSNFDTVALDFNHNTVPGSEAYQGEPAKIAAQGTPEIAPGEGIWLKNLNWTPEGSAAVEGKHYSDLSPTLQLNGAGEAIFIHSAALCRQGAIPGLTLFSADVLGEKLFAESDNFRLLLTLILGLPDSATDAQIETAARGIPDIDRGPDTLSTHTAIHDRLTAIFAAKAGLEGRNLNLLHALIKEPEEFVQSVVNQRLQISPATFAKYRHLT